MAKKLGLRCEMNGITLQELAAKKKLPYWMTNHPVFKSIGKIDKVFPGIGLPNCSEPCDIIGNFAVDEAKRLLASMISEIRAPLNSFLAGQERQDIFEAISIIEQIDTMFCERPDDFLSYVKGSGDIAIRLPESVKIDNEVRFAKHLPLFSVYQFCIATFSRHGWIMPALEKVAGYKDFNSNNVSSNNSTIVFSSDGVDGLWDIATMSMRGISSCIRWDGQHKLTLIGSIADPFTGVIYLTSGKKFGKYGSRMIKRCVVRFVIDAEKEQPYLLIDRMYPSLSGNVLSVFTNFLKSKTKLDVRFGPELSKGALANSYIPRKPIIDQLTEKTLTYRDTKISIGKIPSKVSERKGLNIKIKEANLTHRLKSSIVLSECVKHIVNADAARYIGGADFQYLIGQYSSNLVLTLSQQCQFDPSRSSVDRIKQMCYHFMANKTKLVRSENAKFLRVLRNYFGPEAKNALTLFTLKPMFDFIAEQISTAIKSEVLRMISTTVKPVLKPRKQRKPSEVVS